MALYMGKCSVEIVKCQFFYDYYETIADSNTSLLLCRSIIRYLRYIEKTSRYFISAVDDLSFIEWILTGLAVLIRYFFRKGFSILLGVLCCLVIGLLEKDL